MVKIVSYNINGIRRFAKERENEPSLLDEFMSQHSDADVICFQELKTDSDDVVSKCLEKYADDYDWVTSLSDTKKGYAGVATLVKKEIGKPIGNFGYLGVVNMNQMIREDIGDRLLSEQYNYIPGRICVVFYKDIAIINVYVVNSGGKHEIRKIFDEELARLIQVVQSENQDFHKKVIVVGDFNVCATEFDYWGKYDKAIDTQPGLMQFEIDDFRELCKSCKLTDVFRLQNGISRRYSYYPSKKSLETDKGWRIDNCLVSDEFVHEVVSFPVGQYQGVDHSPVITLVGE